MGALYHQRGEYARAVEAYRRAIEQRPNAAPTHRNLGDSLLRLGRRDEALAAYRRAATWPRRPCGEPGRRAEPGSLAVYLQKAGDRARPPAARRGPATGARRPQVLVPGGAGACPGRPQRGAAALGRALELGYSRADAAKADEFQALRKDARFPALVRA